LAGAGPNSRISSDLSILAQVGALEHQIFDDGLIAEGLSSVPILTTVSPTRPVESENSWVPHWLQNPIVTSLPLSATRIKRLTTPVTAILSVGKTTLAVPLAAMRWQSRHQQIRDGPGSALI
tara:strand:- start:2438 stop:2803 length:366 start_codon:yes stop_codon:yes gene_type:complete